MCVEEFGVEVCGVDVFVDRSVQNSCFLCMAPEDESTVGCDDRIIQPETRSEPFEVGFGDGDGIYLGDLACGFPRAICDVEDKVEFRR